MINIKYCVNTITPNEFHMVLLVEAPSVVNPTTSPPESSINKIALTTNLARSTPVNNYNIFILSTYFYQ